MPTTERERVRKRRDGLRAAGLRLVRTSVPDQRRPTFAEECARQARLVAAADAADHDLAAIIDAALLDLKTETDA